VTQPTPPIGFGGDSGEMIASRWSAPTAAHDTAALLRDLAAICPTSTEHLDLAEHARDWWPLAMRWALQSQVPRMPLAVASTRTTDEVCAVVRACRNHDAPLTVTAGRSGVSGASVPMFGGVVLDITAMAGVVSVDRESGVVEVLPGTFGPDLERALEPHGLTVGHFPQSFDISTVGGWIACLGAGQFSTRYGKIDEMVVGLEVVLADGSVIRTGGVPAAAHGPDVSSMFVGSEGTLGIITRAWLRLHPAAVCERRAVYGFGNFTSGLDACRRIMQRGATPAVLRLYDGPESKRGQGGDGDVCVLLVLDEGDVASVSSTMSVVDEECLATTGCSPRDVEAVEKWMHHRNDTSALQALTRKGFVVDTMEITGAWSRLPAIFDAATSALLSVEHARSATCHLSHSYTDGACLYFTFAASPPPGEFERTYDALWEAGTRAILSAGGNLSHHHGVGLNRARFAAEALGPALDVVSAIKDALDPHGILNPGKMGLPDRFETETR